MNFETIISIIILLVITILVITFFAYKIKKEGFRKTVIKLIVIAEGAFLKGKNTEKFNYVYNRLYDFIPIYLKFIFTKENTIKFIQKIFDETKIALDYKN